MAETGNFAPRDWDSHPPYLSPEYKSTPSWAPAKPLVILPQSLSERTGPVYGQDAVGPLDHDLTKAAAKTGEPNGERIIVAGRVHDEDGRPVPNILLEVWQPNAAGRYNHADDQHDAPIDPNFLGAGRCVTDDQGRYRFITIKPGAYPWGNHFNAWRPNHIHFSLFGPSILTRLITQMYFPGDPLLELDPIFNGVPAASRQLLVAKLSIELSEPEWALAYEFNICLRGRLATPLET
ncbi:MAG: protocatechuate 3,4-dioxygenase subunit beta [Alphaproteobacteria bacterium]